MEILTSVRRLYIRFKSLVNDFVYSFGRAGLLLLVEVYNHIVPVRERRRIRVNYYRGGTTPVIIRDVLIGWKAEEPSGPVWTWQQTEEPQFLPGMQPRPSLLIVVNGLFWVHLKLYKLLYTDNQTFITKY